MRLAVALVVAWRLAGGTGVAGRRGPHHPRGHEPVDHAHHHFRPQQQTLTADSQLLHDAKHIEEDLPVLTQEEIEKLSPEQIEFYYFASHDFDKNSKLDGLELLKAIYHTMEHKPLGLEDDTSIEPEAGQGMDFYIDIVDRTLKEDDTDDDGYVSYAEYRAARARNPKVDNTPVVVQT